MASITMTTTDPGEGSPLSADNYLAVYGGEALLDVFYPVGSYYETSNSTFDPNLAWGGVWEEDSAGRTTVAQDNNTFNVVGDTGGSESHRHDFCIGMHSYYGALVDDDWITGVNGSGAYSYEQETFSKRKSWSGGASTKRNNSLGSSLTTYNETCRRSWGDTDLGSSLQPYVVVKRWHRIA